MNMDSSYPSPLINRYDWMHSLRLPLLQYLFRPREIIMSMCMQFSTTFLLFSLSWRAFLLLGMFHISLLLSQQMVSWNLQAKGPQMSKAFLDVHISARLMEEFMELASANTKKNLETCGILGAFLKNHTFYVTTLILPKQESTANSCQALNEEEIHAIQDGQSLFPVGWIHTHPSQTCFLSSIDLHTQYSYQVMLPEAIAIVMAPTDSTRSYGIFRLTDPGGITVLKECRESGGFHLHPETCSDGSPIYESCSNVYINPNLRFEIIDLRSPPSP